MTGSVAVDSASPGRAGSGGQAVLELQRVSAAYGPYRALFGVTFSIPEGAVVALLGPNGAGKSTVARVATGLVEATEGRIMLGGTNVTRRPAWRIARDGVAHVPEGRGVLGTLTVEENLTLVFRQRLGRQKVAETLARTYENFPVLGERRKQAAGTLSGGQQRLLSLAKVLSAPPRLLVADELSLGLAPVVIEQVYDNLRRINAAGTALLVVEQQVDRCLEFASKAVVLDHGEVAFEGDPARARETVERIVTAKAERADAGARQVDWSDVQQGRRSGTPRR
jgi:branched-chain amino acid transport system ATP-binding protein